mmetsp:Transcript_24167/g.83911  ORF Transcript_24167/g.83911 Transcript_24167/m.83911 type:complete len:254 (+) Transcript_24167:3180-3941(+)
MKSSSSGHWPAGTRCLAMAATTVAMARRTRRSGSTASRSSSAAFTSSRASGGMRDQYRFTRLRRNRPLICLTGQLSLPVSSCMSAGAHSVRARQALMNASAARTVSVSATSMPCIAASSSPGSTGAAMARCSWGRCRTSPSRASLGAGDGDAFRRLASTASRAATTARRPPTTTPTTRTPRRRVHRSRYLPSTDTALQRPCRHGPRSGVGGRGGRVGQSATRASTSRLRRPRPRAQPRLQRAHTPQQQLDLQT